MRKATIIADNNTFLSTKPPLSPLALLNVMFIIFGMLLNAINFRNITLIYIRKYYYIFYKMDAFNRI